MTTGIAGNMGLVYMAPNQDQPDVTYNENLDAAARLIGGKVDVAWPSDADYSLATGTTPPQWQYAVVSVTDTGAVMTVGRNLICPVVGKPYVLFNGTAQKVTLKTTASGKTVVEVDAGAIRNLMVTVEGNVFPIGAQVIPPT